MIGNELEVRQLQCGYGHHALFSAVSASFTSGTHLLLGENGIGKSALLATLAGQLRPIDGSVFISQENILSFSTRKRSHLVGYLPQRPSFGQFQSVQEYMESSLTHGAVTSRKDIEAAISNWKLGAFIEKNPYSLSGGEQQRVHLARLFSIPRKVYLLDEPHSSLDVRMRGFLMEFLGTLKDTIVVFSDHAAGFSTVGLKSVHFLSKSRFSTISADTKEALCQEASRTFGGSFLFHNDWVYPRLL